jgi:serine/threonine protein kinase
MATPASLIGAQLGPYQIQALLGSGGMATVYQGLDTNLQRPVAIKVLSPVLANDPDYGRRFKREAQLIASLHHPNVAQVYAFGEQDGATYMV